MPIRILIAEDSLAVRSALRGLLQGAGPWEIFDVDNGAEAIAKAQELKPNLIILDLVMPVMDGLNAARQISRLHPEIPLLMHTMHWSPQVEVEAQKVGVRKVVSKANSKILIATVQEMLITAAASAGNSQTPPPLDIPAPPLIPPAAVLESSSAPEKSDTPPILETVAPSAVPPAPILESGADPAKGNPPQDKPSQGRRAS